MNMNEMTQVREFVWTGRTGPFTLELTPGVFTPSSTSTMVASALEIKDKDVVIDAGCGSGVLSFVAARLGAGRIVGSDISDESIRVAKHNAQRLGLETVTEFRVGSLFDAVDDVVADVVIADVSGIPDAIAKVTGWFPNGKGGGPTGAELPIAMLEQMDPCLKPGGRVYLPTGTIQAESRVIEAARRIFGSNIERLIEREFPLPNVIGKSKEVAQLVSDGLIELRRRGSRVLWKLSVWRCTKP
jgi:SAM-dependent methyltransferase